MDAETFDPQLGEPTGIAGVLLYRRRSIMDDRGMVRHFMKATDAAFTRFGEVYFSTCNPMVVKAWHLHTRMTLNYVAVTGPVLLGLVDGRADSPTHGVSRAVILEDQGPFYRLITIPPGVWNGFRATLKTQHRVVIANFASEPHDPDEIERVHPDDFGFPFNWGPYWKAG